MYTRSHSQGHLLADAVQMEGMMKQNIKHRNNSKTELVSKEKNKKPHRWKAAFFSCGHRGGEIYGEPERGAAAYIY